MNSDAVDWLLEHAPREHWVEYYFPGNRYGYNQASLKLGIPGLRFLA